MPKPRKPLLRTREPGDSTAFNNANTMLERLDVRYWRPNKCQLKIGKINYFPTTGRICVDGEPKARPKRGLEALQTLLDEQKTKLGVYVAKRNAAKDKREREELEREQERSVAADPARASISFERGEPARINQARIAPQSNANQSAKS